MALMKYDYKTTLTTSSFDAHGRFRPFAVLDFFQTAAGLHANIIKVGYDDMIKNNLGWLVSKTKIRFLKKPSKYDQINVHTFPVTPGRCDFDRLYKITDNDGNLLIEAKTKWAAVNLETKRIARCSEVQFDGEFLEDDQTIEFDRNKKITPLDLDYKFDFTVRYSHTDDYHHLNNARYADLILDSLELNSDDEIYEMQINNLSEAPLGSTIKVYAKRFDKTIETLGTIEANGIVKNCFTSTVTVK